MDRPFGMPPGPMPLFNDFPREMHTNFVQPDSMGSYYGVPRQSGPPCRPLLQGVDALFQDYRGGSQGPLEFDFGGVFPSCFPKATHAAKDFLFFRNCNSWLPRLQRQMLRSSERRSQYQRDAKQLPRIWEVCPIRTLDCDFYVSQIANIVLNLAMQALATLQTICCRRRTW